jgi:hypothetical protein
MSPSIVPHGNSEIEAPAPEQTRPRRRSWKVSLILITLMPLVAAAIWIIHRQTAAGSENAQTEPRALEGPQGPSDFKGLKFGMTRKEAQQASPNLKGCSAKYGQCYIETDLLKFIVDFDSKGRLFEIRAYFDANEFDQIEHAFVTKYGEPTKTFEDVLTNTFGSSYLQTQHYWYGNRLRIAVRRYRKDYGSPFGDYRFKGNYDLQKGEVDIFEPPSSDELRKEEQKLKHALD